MDKNSNGLVGAAQFGVNGSLTYAIFGSGFGCPTRNCEVGGRNKCCGALETEAVCAKQRSNVGSATLCCDSRAKTVTGCASLFNR